MEPNTGSSKVIYWIVGIVVVLIVLVMIATRSNKAEAPAVDNSTGTTTVQGGATGSNGSTASGSQTGATNGQTSPDSGLTDAQLLQMIKTAFVKVPTAGVDVALSNGSASYQSATEKGTIRVEKLLGKVFTNDGTDVFVDMTLQKTGTTPVVHYVALFKVQNQKAAYTSAVSIGDRVSITKVVALTEVGAPMTDQSNSISSQVGYRLTVYYLDHQTGTSFDTAPTIQKDVTARVKNHMINK